jgi:tetratricopeptide (TPR) repeat protein
LDGIPLAIELAAARANVLTLEQISKRLDDRFRLLTGGARTALPRQQTLRAMIDWSYNLLSEEERLLFRRLAVFVGGWTLEAAETICSGKGTVPVGEIESDQVLDLLSQLVKKSLVVMTEENGESRYHRLETIRQYAREKLFETEEAAQIRDRHLDYFIQFADQGDEELLGPNDLIWIEKIEIENDNLRTALSWSLESPGIDPQKALQLSGALQNFWDTRGYTSEGYQWLSDALKQAPATPTSQHCRALIGAGLLCIRLSQDKKAAIYLDNALILARQLNISTLIIRSLLDSPQAMEDTVEGRKRFEEGMALARSTRNQAYLAESLGTWAFAFSDNTSETIHYIKEAYEVAEKLGNARMLAWVLWVYGGIEMQRANYASATSKIQEALRLSQLLKDKHRTAHCLILLGRLASQQTNYDTAIPYAEESLQILRDLSDRTCSGQSIMWLGWNAYLGGDAGRAIEYIEECLFIFRDIESPFVYMPLVFLGRVITSQGNIQKAKISLFEALESLKKSPDWNYMGAYCLEAVCAIPGLSPDQAARILGKAEAIRGKEAFVIPISERHLVEPIYERLQSQLGKDAFDSARAAGAALSLEQAVDKAIEVLQGIE